MRTRLQAGVFLLAMAIVAVGCSGGASATPTVAATGTPAAATPGASGGSPAATATAASATVDPSAAAAALDAVCAKGVTEGAVNVWAYIDPDVWAAETAPFTAKYPQIKVTQSQIEPTTQVPRILTDVAAGHAPEADFVQGEATTLNALVQQNLIDTSFDWVSYGQPASEVVNGMLRHYRTFRGLGYNTQTVQASDLPNTWEQLIDPKWAGQVMVDPRGYTFQDLGVAWGEQQTIDYVNRLKATDQPIVLKGITTDEVAIASGQAKLNTNIRDAETAEQQAKGAPVDIKYLDYVIEDDSYNAVVKGAPHPNAAACLIAWLNGPDGLALQYQQEYKKNVDAPPTLPAGAHLINPLDTAADVALDTKIATDVANIWAGK